MIRSAHRRIKPRILDKRLFLEKLGLGGGGGAREGDAASDADDAEDFDFGECGARDEDPERVAIEIGRREADAVVEQIEKVINNDALEDVLIAEAEADPEAVKLRTAEKGFALRLERLGELLDEIDGFDFGQRHGLKFAFAGEQFGCVRLTESGRI